MFADEVARAAERHAVACYPQESCGFVVEGAYLPLENRHTGGPAFLIDPQLWVQYGERIQAVVHSHTIAPERVVPRGHFPDAPSLADMRGQLASDLPWGLVLSDGSPSGTALRFWWGGEMPALEGRQWRHGVTDCWAAVRDWHRLHSGIELPEIPRDPDWMRDGDNLIERGALDLPVERIGRFDLARGDGVVMGHDRRTPDHLGVYLGDGRFFHHYRNRLSLTEAIEPWMDQVLWGLRWRG